MPTTAMTKDKGALSAIKQRLDAADGGEVAHESFKRHYENLEKLAANLRKIGMDEREVDENIILVFREYERELTNYINNI
jgi:hypothetical protein